MSARTKTDLKTVDATHGRIVLQRYIGILLRGRRGSYDACWQTLTCSLWN